MQIKHLYIPLALILGPVGLKNKFDYNKLFYKFLVCRMNNYSKRHLKQYINTNYKSAYKFAY